MYFREIAIITLFIFFIHLAELDSKMQYFAAMHECSTLVYIINKQTLLELNYPSWNDQAVNNFF